MSVFEYDHDHGRRETSPAAGRTTSKECGEVLMSVLQEDIVMRLRDAFASNVPRGLVWESPVQHIGQSEVEALYRSVTGRSPVPAEQVLAQVSARGMGHTAVFEELLRPVAVRLGDGWLADECSFFDVTVGVSWLQQALHSMVLDIQSRSNSRSHGRSLLLTGAPGEQHLFGLGIIEQAFVDAGWNVTMMAGADWDGVCDALAEHPFSILGISCSGQRLQSRLKSAIDAARLVSTNRDIKVLVGGHLFLDDKNGARSVGADCFAVDSFSAVKAADSLLCLSEALIKTSG